MSGNETMGQEGGQERSKAEIIIDSCKCFEILLKIYLL